MEAPVIAAIITSGVSFVVAVLGLTAAIMTSRKSTRSTRELEVLKHQLARASSRDAIADDHLQRCLSALSAAITAIQHVKDAIQLTLSSAADSGLDSKSALDGLIAARTAIFSCHETEIAYLSRDEADELHRAKNISDTVVRVFKAEYPTQRPLSPLSGATQERLGSLRAALTDIQHVLRDKRADRLGQRLAVSLAP